jgi:hypothetical protein
MGASAADDQLDESTRTRIGVAEVSSYIAPVWPEKLDGQVDANLQVLSFIGLATWFHLR